MSLKTIAFTGHRPDKLGGYLPNKIRDALMNDLEQRLTVLRSVEPTLTAISGMALGFDQWAALSCIKLGIPFEAAIPFIGQDSRWPAESKRIYHWILAQTSKVHIIELGSYSPLKMQIRNEWMVDRCDLLVAAWDGSSGGTANCVAYANRIGKPVLNLLAKG